VSLILTSRKYMLVFSPSFFIDLMGETEPERIEPLSLEDFKALPRASAVNPERYRRLYLGLPKDLRVELRRLSERARKERICDQGDAVKAAILALELLGSDVHQIILKNRDVQWAIGVALNAGGYCEVSIETEELVDSIQGQVLEVVPINPQHS
jgi:hypothetical protein